MPALLDVYGIPYTFSDPLVMALTLHKGMTKRVLRDGGLPTPAFAEVASADGSGRPRPAVPAVRQAGGRGHGQGHRRRARCCARRAELRERCLDLLARFRQPVLVESYLPGREFTVGITGTGAAAEVVGTLEIVLLARAEAGAYTYANKENCEELVEYRRVMAGNDAAVARAEEICPGGLAAAGLPRRRPVGPALRRRPASPSSWRSTRWPACTRSTRTCP